MKVVHFTNNLTDGAGKAVYRIHKGLIESGLESIVLVAKKDFLDHSVKQVIPGYKNIDNPIGNNKDLFIRGIKFISFLFKEIRWKFLYRKWSPLSLFNFIFSQKTKQVLVPGHNGTIISRIAYLP